MRFHLTLSVRSCIHSFWLQSGGAVNIGFDSFSSASSCAANPNPPARSMVTMDACTVINNVASSYGGGISVQDGIFVLQVHL